MPARSEIAKPSPPVGTLAADRAALLASERRYQDLVRMSSDAIFMHEAGRITFINDAGLRMLKATRAEQILGRPPLDFFHPGYHDLIRQRVAQLSLSPIVLPPLEEEMVALDGATVFVEVSASSYFTEGRLVIQVVCRDTTPRKLADDTMRQERNFSDAVLNSLPGVLYLYDQSGKFLRWSKNFERVSGYHTAEIAVMHPLDFFTPAEKDLAASRIAEVFQHGKSDLEAGFVTKDGRVIPYYFTGVRTHLEGRPCLVGVGLDISERKLAERALSESEARYHALFKYDPDGILIADAQSNYLDANPSACRMLGYTHEELVGLHASDIVAPSEIPHIATALDTIKTRSDYHREWLFRRKDGSTFPAEVMAATMPDGHLLGVIRDTSERHQAEAALRELNETLEHKVADRTSELESVNRELETFCYSVSHDLRAPLRGIAGFTQILAENYRDALDDTARNYFDRVLAATSRMGDLIDDLLNLSRVTRDELHRGPVNLTSLARDVVAALRHASPARSVDVVISEGLETTGDARLLRVMLENLLGNAWKFTSKNPAARLEFTSHLENSERVFSISDNGAGFDMRYAGKLFAPFQRLHRLTEFPGTGIGLATVQRIIHRHGGRVWAQAEVSRGATFHFTVAAHHP